MHELLKFANKVGLPDEVVAVVERSITVEYASLTKSGAPITYPVTPYVHPDGMTLSISTGLTYTSKADRARNNPHVGLLYSDSTGSGIDDAPVVLVFGHGVVRDGDLQGNTDRYVKLSAIKVPSSSAMPAFIRQRMPFYYARIWIEVLPLRVLYWRKGDMQSEPQEWRIDPAIALPESDPKPAPLPKNHDGYVEPPQDWHDDLQTALSEMGKPVLTTVVDGYPVPLRVLDAKLSQDTVTLTMPTANQLVADGQACLTFHQHDANFSYQWNRVFTGNISGSDDGNLKFTVSKQIGDWSLKGSTLSVLVDFFGKGRKLNKRLAAEAQRRGQPVPTINL